MKKFISALAGAGALLALCLPASANSLWNFTTSGANISAVLNITTSDTPSTVLGGFDIVNITGTDTINGVTNNIVGLVTQTGTPSATGLFTSPSGHAWYYNDVLFSGGTPFVDNNGPVWKDAAGNFLNWYTTSPSTYYISADHPDQYFNPGDLQTALAFVGPASAPGATPLPPAVAMFGSVLGIGGLGGWLKRRKRKQAGSASPMLAAA